MIRDPSDPTNSGLFSKCARNHASKLKPHYHPPSRQSSSQPHQPHLPTKKAKGRDGFDFQVSREQREKAYQSGEVPPVGKYNPVRKQHPKLVWDILKAYSRPKKQSQPKAIQKEIADEKAGARAGDQNEAESHKSAAQQQKKQALQKRDLKSIVSKKTCQVNMSRQTGRRGASIQSRDWGDIDIMRSIGYVKGKITKNIVLGQRRTQRVNKVRMFNTSTYDYDYRILKPEKKGLLDFSMMRGRSEKTKTENSYSYQHYDYDQHVWNSNSHVFPNTKTHVSDFRKQTDRYKSEWKDGSHAF